MEIYYKYRSLSNWKFILDIFVNRRFYSSSYKFLNDPMEGIYYYHEDISQNLKDSIKDEKLQFKICSLSKKYNDTLMWSHYTDSHKGVVFGVKIDEKQYDIKEIEYVDTLLIDNNELVDDPTEIAKKILSKKLRPWEYEEEVRVLDHSSFINVDVEEIYLGCKIHHSDKDLLESITKKYMKKAKIIKMKTSDFKMII